MLKIFEQIVGKLEGGEYDLIIGVDASGRIPTFIMDKLVNYIYTKKGHDYHQTRFFAGSGIIDSAAEQIRQWNPRKKVLIVEDTIVTGNSIKFLTSALKEINTHFDIIAVSSSRYPEKLVSEFGADNVYLGGEGDDYTSIYARRNLSGVIKKRGEGGFAKPYKRVMEKHTDTSPKIQEDINEARADADIVVNNLIDWYESQKHEP